MTPATIPRWGLGSFFAAWFAGLVGAVLAVGVVAAATGLEPDEDSVTVLLAGLGVQGFAVIGAIWLVSRTRGQGSLTADFGFGIRAADWTWVLIGAGLQIGSGLLLLPLSALAPDQAQSVVESFRDARDGPEILIFAVAVVALAPLAEELLFRGLLLRALLRRVSAGWAVVASALVFAGVHLVLDPSLGSAQALPALLVLGLVAGDQAVRTRSLSRPILLHAGFNLLTAIGILAL